MRVSSQAHSFGFNASGFNYSGTGVQFIILSLQIYFQPLQLYPPRVETLQRTPRSLLHRWLSSSFTLQLDYNNEDC